MIGIELLALGASVAAATYQVMRLVRNVKGTVERRRSLAQYRADVEQEELEREIHIKYVEKMNYIKKTMTEIYFYAKQIENREIKQKAYRGLMIAEQIYTNLEKEPDEIKKMERFCTYYLALFLKLVKSQIELTEQNIPLEQIKKTLSEIERGLAQITIAFKYILGQTLSDKLMDIETDVDVLGKLEESNGQK